jgi:energy-coupling factor transporter ATP-binding protein EcfA2
VSSCSTGAASSSTTPPTPSPASCWRGSGSPCLELSGVAHRYPDGTGSLHDIDLTLSPGERLALVGANGSGKSTLLGLLARELRPTLGRLIASESRSTRPLLIPQNPDLSLFCESVEEEIAYGPREARLPLEAVRARVAHAATALSVEKLLGRRPQALSRGQRLRVAVAAALACEPSILLLDEPTAGQDRLRVATLMRALLPAMAGRSLVFATHDLDLALRFATRLAVLDAGRLLSVAGPAATRALLASGRLPSLAPPALPRRAPP